MPGWITCIADAARYTISCMAGAKNTPIMATLRITKSFFAGNTRETSAGVQAKNRIQTRNCEIDQLSARSLAPASVQ